MNRAVAIEYNKKLPAPFITARGKGFLAARLMKIAEEHKRKQEELMIEGCKEMYGENLKVTKEFEAVEDLNNW